MPFRSRPPLHFGLAIVKRAERPTRVREESRIGACFYKSRESEFAPTGVC